MRSPGPSRIDGPGPRSRSGVPDWAIWRLPRRVRAYLFVVEAVAAALIVAAAVRLGTGGQQESTEWGLVVLLVVAFGIHVELSLQAERQRRRIAETRYCDLSTVWTFAAALTLPPFAASITVVAGFVYSYFRVARPAGTPPHRHTFSVATMVLAVFAVDAARELFGDDGQNYQSMHGVVSLALGIVVYAITNTMLVAIVIRLSSPQTSFAAIFRGGDLPLEFAGLCLGAITALVIMPGGWMLWLVLLPPLLMLERTMLVAPLEHGATVDAKTGLLNAATWRARTQALLDAGRGGSTTAAVLILDLDHFKAVNDRYGHLAGDTVLQAVSAAVTSEIRDGDLAGRFGGEEFVVCLADLRGADGAGVTREICERIRGHVQGLRLTVETDDGPMPIDELTVSVGAAVFPGAGSDLATLLACADEALYAAKRAGRNRVALYGG